MYYNMYVLYEIKTHIYALYVYSMRGNVIGILEMNNFHYSLFLETNLFLLACVVFKNRWNHVHFSLR